MHRVELKAPHAFKNGVSPYRLFLFLMHRVELKANFILPYGVVYSPDVPNAPCGVERNNTSLTVITLACS
jgi:hypothetical protein